MRKHSKGLIQNVSSPQIKKNQKCTDMSFMATLLKILKEPYILEKKLIKNHKIKIKN